MGVVPQHATATSDGAGNAIFKFPDVPQGKVWCGTTAIPSAPAGAVGTVMAGGELLGSSYGPGFYGPWTVNYSQQLTISVTGLDAHTQYQAVWHPSDEAQIWPTAITAAFEGSVTVPIPLEVTVENFPDPQPVSGTVTTEPTLATSATGGSVSMTGSAVALPSHAATQGVVLRAPAANAHPLTVNGFTLDPGAETPLLPVVNSNVFSATGTSPDVLSYLVT